MTTKSSTVLGMTPWLGRGILGTLAGAGGAGLMSAAGGLQEGETKEERSKRILRNAVLGGAMGGGAAAVLPEAFKAVTKGHVVANQREADKLSDQSIKNLGIVGATLTGGASGVWSGYEQRSLGKSMLDTAKAEYDKLLPNLSRDATGTLTQAGENSLAGMNARMVEVGGRAGEVRGWPTVIGKGLRKSVYPALAAYFLTPFLMRGRLPLQNPFGN